MSLKLFIKEIADRYLRQNFETIEDELEAVSHLKNFRFFELRFTSAVTNYKHYHGLGFVPKDIIRTRFTGEYLLTFNYDLFDSKYIDITTEGPCEIRGLVGTLEE
jgi:hypothetical protein